MICSVCKKNRHDVSVKRSALMPGLELILCNECNTSKREPRWTIVLAGRSGKIDLIKPYLKNHRYVGDKITAAEIHV